ncbi:MAG: CoA-binding protein [Alphaproteobacteria bacterium]|nr:CoA-binding protein [Alphaproteobacteria bacterium]
MSDVPPDPNVLETFRPLVEPRAIAVAGASASSVTLGNEIINHVRNFGFKGGIYPIHPSAEEVEGLRAYRTFADLPEIVDYAYVSVAAPSIPGLLSGAGGKVRFAQVSSSGFGETVAGKELEDHIVAAARAGGSRLVGPNCIGIYCPKGHLTWVGGVSPEPGPVGIVTQSGGLGTNMIRRGNERGVRFSSLVSVGNSADIGPNDLLEFYLADPDTRVVGLYLEDIKDGRRFFDILRAAAGAKPVILLRGGRSREGRRAAVSHTGAMASDERVWQAAVRQLGLVQAETLDEFMDILLAFQMLTPRPSKPTENVVLFGNGGGISVMGTDIFSSVGLSVPAFSEETRKPLDDLNLPPGTSVENPIDTPRSTLRVEGAGIVEKILEAAYASGDSDALVMHLNIASFVGSADQRFNILENLIQNALHVRARMEAHVHFALVLRSDGSAEADERKRADRTQALALGIPVFDEIPEVARALAGVSRYERFLASRNT